MSGKRPREDSPSRGTKGGSNNAWLRAWAWKREHRPDRVRFDRPYTHSLALPDGGERLTLTVHQRRFKEQGFASTVWDSAIVVAKWAEKHGRMWPGKRVLDLSAGCGLPGLVCAKLGAVVTATDLAPNLPLLRKNAEANGCDVTVMEHAWGSDVAPLDPPFDVVLGCDLMYVHELAAPLVASLAALSGPATTVVVAHGRNRGAEAEFLRLADQRFEVEHVRSEELDEVYQCVDVDCLRLRPKRGSSGGDSTAASAGEAAGAEAATEARAPESGAVQQGSP